MVQTLQATGPRTVGKYQIVAGLAKGNMSTVYKGYDPAAGKAVAIKVASTTLARNEVLLKRFEQEFRSTSNLRHPNIVRALDFGWEGSLPFIVMEFVEGEDLWTRIERAGSLSEAEALGYLIQVAEGLHEAHKNGIIHRDLRPDNILLTMDGQAKITDLGLSKDLDSDLELTRDNHGLGTPNFIAPEQFGDAKHAGVRCDIYSLGATLYMAVTGQLPFDGANIAAILKMKLADDLLSPRKLIPSLSEHVDFAIRRATLADPARRFASCPEFLAALSGEAKGSAAKASAKPRGPVRQLSAAAKLERERRTSPRYDCALPMSCTINPSLHATAEEIEIQTDAQVCDISVGGIGLFLTRRFEPGTILKVVVANAKGDFERTREVCVLRVTKADGSGWFLAGALVEKLTKEDLRRLL